MKFLKNNGSNLLIAIAIILLLLPQTGLPIKAFVARIFSFAPSEISEERREVLTNYDWELSHLDGETVHLNQSQGKVTLINFWATWCPPCVAEMPSLQKLYDQYHEKVDFYFVSQESVAKLENFMVKKNYSFPVYVQEFAAPEVLKASALPTTYVISKDGVIVIDETGAANWNSQKVKALLDRLLAE